MGDLEVVEPVAEVRPAGPPDPVEPAGDPTPGRTWNRRMVIALAVTVAVVASLAVVFAVTTSKNSVLGGLAAAAAAGQPVPPGRFQHFREEQSIDRWYPYREENEYWIGADGDTWIRTSVPPGGDGEVSHSPPGTKNYEFGFPDLVSRLDELPREPQALLSLLNGDDKTGDNFLAFTAVVNLLRTRALPPDLNGALFKVLALMPQVDTDSSTTDSRGRAGVGIIGDFGPDHTVTLIVDPGTGLLWERRSNYLSAPKTEGEAVPEEDRRTLMAAPVVDDLPDAVRNGPVIVAPTQ